MAIYVPPRHEKAVTGVGAINLTYDRPLFGMTSSPQRLAEQAQGLYHTHPWVHAAEKAVSGRGGAVAWHLEDANDDEITDESPAPYLAIRELLEKPQAAIADVVGRPLGRRELWTLTLRHMGLCGTSFWYLDQVAALSGIPLAIIYLNPARMWPATDAKGNLLGWSLDGPPGERGALPLERSEVLPFYLDPPDNGHFGIGLVESVGQKAHLSTSADRYMANVLDSGGRLAGLVSPKTNTVITDDQWRQFLADARQIAEDPQSAKRLQAVRGAIDFVQTAATPQEAAVTTVATMTRDDILGLWNVPGSQIGLPITRALGQDSAQAFEEAVLWQNAIGPRLTAFWETIQYGLLDRFTATPIELVLDQPSFDDDRPKYDLAEKAAGQPLTRNERREILGLDPLPEWDPDTGEPLGIAIDLPIAVSVVGKGEAETAQPKAPAPAPVPPSPPVVPPEPVAPAGEMLGKARLSPKVAALHGSLTALRATVQKRVTPKLRASVADVLAEQRHDIAARIRAKAEHIRAKPSDTSVWFAKGWDEKLDAALRPSLQAMADSVSGHIRKVLIPGKAAAAYLVATRVSGINETTRSAIAAAIADAIDAGDDVLSVADEIERAGFGLFDGDRAELIARTELMDAYNAAALGTYGEAGIREVQAIDGDEDDECAERDGQTFSIDEADGIDDHPNGTLDWVPVL